MWRDQPRPASLTRVLLDLERPLPRLSTFTRARALARAREAITRAPVGAPPVLPRGIPRWTLPLAVATASLASMAIVHHFEGPAPQPTALLVIADEPAGSIALVPRTAAMFRLAPEIPAEPPSGRPAPVPHEERVLLQRARAAVAANAWPDAHWAVTEHARRFPAGQLAEEREALRVKTLIGLGKMQEAQQAARAFEARFPRSVLRHVVAQGSGVLL